MGMNMMGENNYIYCLECTSRIFHQEERFLIKKNGKQLDKEIVSKHIICSRCGCDMTTTIKREYGDDYDRAFK